MTNRGARRLARVKERDKLRQLDLAERLGCSQPTVSALLNGEQPSLAVAVRAKQAFGIDPSDWTKVDPEPQAASGKAAS